MILVEEYNIAMQVVKQYELEQSHLTHIKNNTCRLNRIPKNCCIITNTSFKLCDNCGHKI